MRASLGKKLSLYLFPQPFSNQSITVVEVPTARSWPSPRSRLTSVSVHSSLSTNLDTDLLTDANVGVDEIVEEQRPFALKHKVSFGDLYVPLAP